jgi:hypothetical protein
MSQKILLGLISPTLKIPISENQFAEQVEYQEASYMLVSSQQFYMGSETVGFTVYYGNVTKKDDVIISFQSIYQQKVTLSGQVVDDWGTDDSDILYAIAAEVGTNIEQIVIVEFPSPYYI